MNTEKQRIWNEAHIQYQYSPRDTVDTRNTSIRIVCSPTEIQTFTSRILVLSDSDTLDKMKYNYEY